MLRMKGYWIGSSVRVWDGGPLGIVLDILNSCMAEGTNLLLQVSIGEVLLPEAPHLPRNFPESLKATKFLKKRKEERR